MAGRYRVRRRWSEEEKRRIVAQTLIPGMSVSQVVRRYSDNSIVMLFPEERTLFAVDFISTRHLPFRELSPDLFGAMSSGGRIGFEAVAWFNGGLFDDDETLPLVREEIVVTLKAAALDWSEIDPSIFGTLFERGLDPDKRSRLGAHYTDREKIMLIVEPVIVRPLLAEWEAAKVEIGTTIERARSEVAGWTDPAAPAGQSLAAELPRTGAQVRGAGSGLRFGEFPVLGPARAQGHRAPCAARSRGVGPPTRISGRRAGEREGDRDQRLRGGARPRVGVDRRNPVDAAQRLPRSARPDPEAAGDH